MILHAGMSISGSSPGHYRVLVQYGLNIRDVYARITIVSDQIPVTARILSSLLLEMTSQSCEGDRKAFIFVTIN